jgi:hypothetical protein
MKIVLGLLVGLGVALECKAETPISIPSEVYQGIVAALRAHVVKDCGMDLDLLSKLVGTAPGPIQANPPATNDQVPK